MTVYASPIFILPVSLIYSSWAFAPTTPPKNDIVELTNNLHTARQVASFGVLMLLDLTVSFDSVDHSIFLDWLASFSM